MACQLSSAPSPEPPPVNSGGQRWPMTVNDGGPPPQQLFDRFANKGAKDPIYGMAIPMEIMSDEIKASVHYLNYLAKSKGEKLVKCRGKGLLTKKGVQIVVEKIKTKHVPNKKNTKAVIKETDQLEDVADTIYSEETKHEEEIPLIQRQTGVVIGRQAHKDSDEGTLDHSKKLKGVEALSDAAQ
ncbi:hypothetical protein Tco_0801285 [Tanacetum coccineum]|uniref:Uncharacterized protein n=1 Tax=Tanacetum coccineum TaxID=301880 RepID=A0ABQ4ZZN5_9ASTR